MAVWLGLLCLLSSAVLAEGGPNVNSLLMFAFLATSVAVALIWSFRDSRLPPWICVLLVVTSGLVAAVPGLGESGCTRVSSWWGPDGALIALAVLAMLAPSWHWLAAGLASFGLGLALFFVTTIGIPANCTAAALPTVLLDGSVIIALVFMRRAMTKYGQQALRAYRKATDERVATEALQAQSRVRENYLRDALNWCDPLLNGLAEGRLDPMDTEVRERCGRAEAVLRAVVDIDPGLGALGALIQDVVLRFGERGVMLRTQVATPINQPAARLLRGVRSVVMPLVDGLPRGASGVLSLSHKGSQTNLTLVFSGVAQPVELESHVTGIVVSQQQFEDQLLVEIQWQSSSESGILTA